MNLSFRLHDSRFQHNLYSQIKRWDTRNSASKHKSDQDSIQWQNDVFSIEWKKIVKKQISRIHFKYENNIRIINIWYTCSKRAFGEKKAFAMHENESVANKDGSSKISVIINRTDHRLFDESYAHEKTRLDDFSWNYFEKKISFKTSTKIRMQNIFIE